MTRYFLELSYDGTDYAGWQIQPGVNTVQGELQAAFQTLFRTEIAITGCGRTDKGVHARNYIAHCDLTLADRTDKVIYKLNQILPSDIVCHRLIPVENDAHARFDAVARSYIYHIHLSPDPFKRKYSTLVPYGHLLDLSLLKEIDDVILQTKDFSSFCKLHGSSKTTLCTMFSSKWTIIEETNCLTYEITANRFLRGMVRLIVGSSLSLARGKMTINELKDQIGKGTRNPHMTSAKPDGLALTRIAYPYFNPA